MSEPNANKIKEWKRDALLDPTWEEQQKRV